MFEIEILSHCEGYFVKFNMNNIKIEIEDYPNVDRLKIGRILIFDIFENKFMKFLVKFFLICKIFLFLIETYNFLSIFKVSNFIIHGSTYLFTLIEITTYTTTLVFTPMTKKYIKTIKLWKINIDGKYYQLIIKESKIFNKYVILITVLSLINGFMYTFPLKYETKFYFAYDIFKQFPRTWENILSWVYKSTCLLTFLIGQAGCNQFIYLSAHIRHQVYILPYHLENLNVNCEGTDELHLPDDANYQKGIKNKIVLIGKRYHKIKLNSIILRNKVKDFLIIVYLNGIAAVLSFLLLIQSELQVHFSLYLRVTVLLVYLFIIFSFVAWSGQETENISEELINTFINLKWYTWNKENQRIYLMLLPSISRTIKIDLTDEISLNYNLALRFARAVYSVISVFGSIN